MADNNMAKPVTKKFSIIVPVYQNGQNLPVTIPTLLKLEKELLGYELELIFVDDGSTDNSYEVLADFHRQQPERIKVIKLAKNFGQTPATQAGLRYSTGDVVGIISADLQDPPELFATMLHKWETGTKLILAERDDREENSRHRLISNTYWLLVSIFVLKGFPRRGFDFCLFDRQVADQANAFTEKNSNIFLILFSLGFPYIVIPYKRRLRIAGKSQWTLTKKFKLFFDTVVGFSYLPIRIISYMGLLISISSCLFGAFSVYSYFYYRTDYPGWTSTVVITSVLCGLILLTLGIIGEYIWRILDEVRKRPNYVIDRIDN